MGKRIIQQRRGRGSFTYRVRKKGFRYEIKYPELRGQGQIIKLINSSAHTSPLAKIKIQDKTFLTPASKNSYEGQEISIGNGEIEKGNILELKNIPVGTKIFNIERKIRDGGKLIRAGGTSATLSKKGKEKVAVLLPSKKEVWFNEKCLATIGTAGGHGRLEKPMIKAGKKYKVMKAKGKLWPRTSPVKMNAIDHPFGSGRGRNPSHGKKGKIPKRNAPAGAKVGTLRPKRTGRRKK